jgi:hypothetical protein
LVAAADPSKITSPFGNVSAFARSMQESIHLFFGNAVMAARRFHSLDLLLIDPLFQRGIAHAQNLCRFARRKKFGCRHNDAPGFPHFVKTWRVAEPFEACAITTSHSGHHAAKPHDTTIELRRCSRPFLVFGSRARVCRSPLPVAAPMEVQVFLCNREGRFTSVAPGLGL